MARKKDISEVKPEIDVINETPVSKPKRQSKAKKDHAPESAPSDVNTEVFQDEDREIIETPQRKRQKTHTKDLQEPQEDREIIETPRSRKKTKPAYTPSDEVWIREIPEPSQRTRKSKKHEVPSQEIIEHVIVEKPKRTRKSDPKTVIVVPTTADTPIAPISTPETAIKTESTPVKTDHAPQIHVHDTETSNNITETASTSTHETAEIPHDQTAESSAIEPSTQGMPLFPQGVKLTRRRGKTVPAQATRGQVQTVPSTSNNSVLPPSPSAIPEPVPSVFQPRVLQTVLPEPEPGAFDARMLRHTLHRRAGKRMHLDALRELAMRYAGFVRAAAPDRAPIFNPPQRLSNIIDPKISAVAYNALCQMLHDEDIVATYHASLQTLWKWHTLYQWYGSIDAFYLWAQMPTTQTPTLFEAKQLNAPIQTSPLMMSDANVIEGPAPDPAVTAIFEIFNLPLTPYVSDALDPDTMRRLHIAHHCDRITALFADWARSLGYIDKGVFGGPENKLLSICFMERFQQILAVDRKASEAQGIVLPDIELKQRFYLDDVDMLLLWLLAAAEMDPNFKNALKDTWEAMTVVYLSAGSLMRFFCTSALERAEVMDRLSPSSPMALAGLFKIQISSTPTQPLYFEIIISEQIIRQFAGISALSLASTQYAELLFPHFDEKTYVAESHLKTFRIIKNYIERPKLNRCPNLERENLNFVPSMAFLVEGLPGSGRTTLIKIMASRLNRPVIVVQTNPLASVHPTDAEEYLKTVFTDAALMDAFVCLRDAGGLLTEEKLSSMLARQLAQRAVVCAICVDLAVKTLPVIDPYITFKTKMDGNLKDNATAYWTPHLNLPHLERSKIDVLALSQRMALQPFQIQKATKLAYYSSDFEAQSSNGKVEIDAQSITESAQDLLISNKELEKAAAVQVTKNIGNLAFVTDPEIDLSDVVVSDDIMEKIQQIIGSAINRRRVLYEWGLCKRIRRGTGVIALFDGEPGTGKTHSAEAIAHELGLSLMRVNIATMVDKYIGETEKNLTTIFEQARPDMQLLLFDEADSLFTKRTSNVSKSNDRYSNMSVNVLLQLVERYEGVSILTTNLKNAIDPAFERRITYKVYFPMPKKPERERLWKYMCPPDILTAEPIDYEWLSELEMSGGEIKNAVLTAAFTAATRGQLLDSAILYNAGVAEASAAGRVMRRYEEGEDFI